MLAQPLFSILIAQYNNGVFFQQCYDSIISQTYTNWEVIIVDDASTDDSIQVMKNIIGEDNRFAIIENSANNGCGYTKRKCIEIANGSICGFLDPDDALAPRALEVLVASHFEHPDASVVYSNHYICDKNLNIQHLCHWTKQQPKDVNCYQRTYVGHFLTFKRGLYAKSKGINPKLKRAVDIDLHCHLEEQGDFVFVNEPLYYYRLHERGISTYENRDKALVWVDIVKILHGLDKDKDFEKTYVAAKVKEIKMWRDDLSQVPIKKLIKEVIKRLRRKVSL